MKYIFLSLCTITLGLHAESVENDERLFNSFYKEKNLDTHSLSMQLHLTLIDKGFEGYIDLLKAISKETEEINKAAQLEKKTIESLLEKLDGLERFIASIRAYKKAYDVYHALCTTKIQKFLNAHPALNETFKSKLKSLLENAQKTYNTVTINFANNEEEFKNVEKHIESDRITLHQLQQ